MGSKLSNSQVATPSAMSVGIASAFGDNPEEEARKRQMSEDAAALSQAQQVQGQVPSVWSAMGMDAAGGLKGLASDAWDTMKKKK